MEDNSIKNMREYMVSDGKVDIDGTLFFCGNAILDLAARMDEAVKKIYELELASPCPLLKSICEDWEYDAKPSPDKQEMVERYTVRICEEASVKHPNKLVEALVDFRKDILRQFAEEVRRG